MNTRIKSDFTMTPQIAEYLDKKLEDIQKLISDDAARCEVELSRAVGHSQQGDVWRAELTVIHFGERLYAVAQEESINAAIDIAKDEMMQQLRKTKGRHTTLARRLGARFKRFVRRGE